MNDFDHGTNVQGKIFVSESLPTILTQEYTVF